MFVYSHTLTLKVILNYMYTYISFFSFLSFFFLLETETLMQVLARFCMWRTMLNIFRSVYTRIFIYKDSTFFPSQKCQPMDCMSMEYRNRTVGLIEGSPDPDFAPR